MKIKSFSVENYRSITKAEKLQLKPLTVLIGPNNEGKSNILRALVLGLNILSKIEISRTFMRRYIPRGTPDIDSYDWRRDFPLGKQTPNPSGRTVFDFEFELTDDEKNTFHNATGSHLTGMLPVRLSIGKEYDVTFQFRKKGRHSAAISKKRYAICKFIRSNIAFEYVASVRTAESAIKVVNKILSQELETIEDHPDFAKAVQLVESLQAPILKAVSKTVYGTLRLFLRDVKNVKLQINREDRFRALRQHCEIKVNDGTETDLRLKGDGMQSLASIALIRHASESSARGRQLVLSIEEPETHLHPDAIHELKKVLLELSKLHQVVLTTHNPVLVNKVDVTANIIVDAHRARPAESIKEIRDHLGVRLSDNLQSAELVLVLEGEEDIPPIRTLLAHYSPTLTTAIGDGRLGFDSLGGASKLVYKLGLLKTAGCNYHVYSDYDQAGRDAVKNAIGVGLLTIGQRTFTQCPGLRLSEIEDIYSVSAYRDFVLRKYNVDLTDKNLGNNGVWSNRVKAQFLKQAQTWELDNSTEIELKREIANIITKNPGTGLAGHRRTSFDALVKILERKMREGVEE